MRFSVQFVKEREHRHFAEISLWFISPLPEFEPLVESGDVGWEEMAAHTRRSLGQVLRLGL